MTEKTEVLAYIGLGGNLEQPVETILAARGFIAAMPGTREMAFSGLYRSAPMGPQDQPEYVNAVMAVSTTLAPLELLDAMQGIENNAGRVRALRWGPRTLDLDVLLYGDEIIRQERLEVPHPGFGQQREFVLYPLAEIAPDLEVPGYGLLSDLLLDCPRRGLELMRHA